MRPLLYLILIISLSSLGAQEARRIRIIGENSPLGVRLGGKTEWKMVTGETLTITSADGVEKVVTPQLTVIEIPAPEFVGQAIPNRTGSCLLLRVMVGSPGGGANYSRLIRLSQNPKGEWTPQTFLANDAPPMNEVRRWISEIGAVSDTGRMVLFKMGEEEKGEGPSHRMYYSWQTWQLDPPKKVADGIRVPNDFDK